MKPQATYHRTMIKDLSFWNSALIGAVAGLLFVQAVELGFDWFYPHTYSTKATKAEMEWANRPLYKCTTDLDCLKQCMKHGGTLDECNY